jgi:hypothetical protein
LVRAVLIGLVPILASYSAQAAAQAVQNKKPVDLVRQLPAGMNAEPTALPEELDAGNTILNGMVECDKMAARLAEMKKLAANLEKVSSFLDKLGTVMTSYTIAQHATDFAKKGEVDGLIDDAQGMIISEGGCTAAGIFCPVYKAGMGAGTLINYAPKVFGWSDETLNDMWTGFWADVTMGTTKYQLDRKIGEFRAKIEQAKKDAANAEARNAQCKAAPKASAVDELLDRSKPAPVTSLTRSGDTGRSLIESGSNDAAAWDAGRPAREQAAEQQRLQQVALEQQQQADQAAYRAQQAQRQQNRTNANNSGLNILGAVGAFMQGYAAGSNGSSAPVGRPSGKCIASKEICDEIERNTRPH